MVFDDTAKEWRPRHGYKKVGTDKEQNWVVEVPGNGEFGTSLITRQTKSSYPSHASNPFSLPSRRPLLIILALLRTRSSQTPS